MQNQQNQSWGGRFAEGTDALLQRFSESVSFDQRLWAQDIRGSQAHAQMLARVGVLTQAEADQITTGLNDIAAEIQAGAFVWDIQLEDVHMNIEARLTARLGEVGKKLHTGRSRNDQVATDVRLYCRDAVDEIFSKIKNLRQVLVILAERESQTILPGFTHLQVAQPIIFGHHLLAWQEMFARDAERLTQARVRINTLPLGSAALAGTTYPIDRAFVAEQLGFERITQNSLDAVSDRDFVIEILNICSLIALHLSRISEELIIWMTPMFGFIDLPDRFCTGSSIMPQKKNPDVAELTRGKTGRVVGNLMNLLVLMKGQPLAYNRDNQEDKEPLFDSLDTVRACLSLFVAMLPELKVHRERCYQAALQGFSTATDLADYLVKKGIPFREAHEIVGLAVAFGVKVGRDLSAMTLEELRQFSNKIENDVYECLTLEGSVAARAHVGGTAPVQVQAQIARLKAELEM